MKEAGNSKEGELDQQQKGLEKILKES